MLGRTHMSIGAITAVAATPYLLHTSLPLLPHMHFNVLKPGLPHFVVAEALFVVSSVISSTFPDFDQEDSLLSRKAEKFSRILTFLAILATIGLLHLQASPWAWIGALVIGLVLASRANMMRKIALGILGAGILALGVAGRIDTTGAVMLAIWTIGAMLTKHRTFTHSIPGFVVFTAGVFQSITATNLMVIPWGLAFGYLMHMLADIPSGGIPLFWPWSVRQGATIIKTQSWGDHIIGLAALVGTVALLV